MSGSLGNGSLLPSACFFVASVHLTLPLRQVDLHVWLGGGEGDHKEVIYIYIYIYIHIHVSKSRRAQRYKEISSSRVQERWKVTPAGK